MSDENLDPYWTPIGYFNSIRELSGAQSSIEDAISQQHIPEFALRQGSEPREINEFSELFSRKKAHDLKVTLTRLRNSKGQEDCLDICLTTNMFQVGIDVDRLGLMLINGQPKSNSEYIQASGRVGRDTKRWVSSSRCFVQPSPEIYHTTRCTAPSIRKCTVMSTSPPQHRSVPELSIVRCRRF